MIEFDIDIKNNEEFKRVLNQLPKNIDNAVYEALKEVINNILLRAKQNAPVDTGRLRADIKARTAEKELEGLVWNEVDYAVKVHETHRSKSQYILRAIKDSENIQKQRIEQKLELLAKRGLI